MPLGIFLFFFWWSLVLVLRSVKTILAGNLRSFSVYSPDFHKSWCRKLFSIEWHKNPFDESKNEGASKL